MPKKTYQQKRVADSQLFLNTSYTMSDTDEIKKAISQNSEIMVTERDKDNVMTAYAHPLLYNPSQVTSTATLGHGEHPVDTKRVWCYWYDDHDKRQSALFNIQNLSVLR